MKLDISNWSTRLLCLLLATDFIFILLHLVHAYTDFISNPSFSLIQERGYAEIFQYVKEYWIVLSLGILLIKNYSYLYLGWFLLFIYILLDDSLEIHEKLGVVLSNKLAFLPWFNLRAVDFGELVVSVLFGLFFLSFITTAYRFSDRISREMSRALIVMLFALAIFGIVFDMIHIAVKSPLLEPILGLLEDGGEQVVMSVIAWFVFLIPERLQLSTLVKPTVVAEVSNYKP